MLRRAFHSSSFSFELIQSFFVGERGANATEYAILMSFIMMIVIAGITFFGLELLGWYDELTAHLKLVLGIP